jgi:hypothetical protein
MMGSATDPNAVAKAARLRAEADTAERLARRTTDDEVRRQLEHIARVYRALADKLDPAGDAAAGPPPPAPDAGQDTIPLATD